MPPPAVAGLPAAFSRLHGRFRSGTLRALRAVASFLRVPAAAGLLLFAVLAAGAGDARAEVLVSNLEEELLHQSGYTFFFVDVSNDRFNEGGVAGAQKFTTGTNDNGYTITSVETCLVYLPDEAVPQVSIYTADADGNPDASLYTLTNPSSFDVAGYQDDFTSCADGNNAFTAPANANLAKETDYFVVFENVGGPQATEGDQYSNYNVAHVVTTNAYTGANGWSIAGRLLRKSPTSASAWLSGATGYRNRPVRIQINGTAGTGTDTTAPRLSTATVDGTSLVLTYAEALAAASAPATSAYSVSVAGAAGVAPSSVAVSGTTVTLTLATAVTFGQTVTVSYTVPSSNPVQDSVGNDAAALTTESVTNNTNTAPVFASATTTRSFAESVGDAIEGVERDIGAAVTATNTDSGDTLTYSLEGRDAGFFTIDSGTGQIKTAENLSYNYETQISPYVVTVRATDTRDLSDTITVNISLTDVTGETPLAPAAPRVTVTAGVTMTLNVTWTAPANMGRPAITSYDVQYRQGTSGSWTDGPQNRTGTSASLTGLDGNAMYQVQVRATNADGDSDWSEPGSGTTLNTPPAFAGTSATRSLAETVGDATVTTAATIGAAVTATDADADTLTYSLEGADAAQFTIDATGQLHTKVGASYDREAKASYVVTVKVADGKGGTDTITVTISLTNETEPPVAPVAPTVTSTPGSTTGLNVTWTAPSNTGRPAITSYDVQYKKTTETAWTDGPQNRTGTSASITGLDGDTDYEVHMRATNADGDSGWSEPGSGRTANNPPVFASARTMRSLAETLAGTTETARNVGAVVTATDPDNTTLTYTLEGTDKDAFALDTTTTAGSAQIRTIAGTSYDFESKPTYTVTVKATDTSDASGVITVTINLTNVTGETPLTPAAPAVTTTTGVTMTLEVTWTAPDNTGRPDITSYDVQYKKTTAITWTAGPQNRTGTSASITGLDGNAPYEVQVRATNADGDSAWSTEGSGTTENTPPAFASARTTRSFPETVRDATVTTAATIGAPVTATDADSGDTLTYSLEGVDAAQFTIDSTTGQLQTKVGASYDREIKATYAVTVKATDSYGGTDTTDVTLTVTNVTEFVSATVHPSGRLFIRFIEDLSATLPPPSALSVTLDDASVPVDSLALPNKKDISVTLIEDLNIRTGQTVTVSYTDPTEDNDPAAIQDEAGNDAASFTDEPVTNSSTTAPRGPSPPPGLTATVMGTTRIDLSWTAPVDNGGRSITGYQIERSPDGTDWTELSTTAGTVTTYTHTVAAGTTHYYRVSAINTVDTGDPTPTTDESTATTPLNPGAPTQPTNLTVRYEKTEVQLSWEAPVDEGDNPVTAYLIEVSTNNGVTWETVETIPVENTGQVRSAGLLRGTVQVKTTHTGTTYRYTHTGLTPRTSYLYRVTAMNGDGADDVSAPIESPRTGVGGSFTATACFECSDAPTNLRARRLSDGQVVLEWTPPPEGVLPVKFYDWWWSKGNDVLDWSSISSLRPRFYVPPPYDEVLPGEEILFKVRARNEQKACVNDADPEDIVLPLVPNTSDCPAGYTGGLKGGVGVETGPIVVTYESLRRRVFRPPSGGGGGGGGGGPAAEPTGYLGNPGHNSFQSGIGILSGWVCAADEVVLELNGSPQRAAYGTERLDTEEVCGDTDNGFGLLFNWNLLGDGDHTVVARADGVEFGRATLTVTTLGAEFLRDVAGECVVQDFPTVGETVTLEWQQTSQNFVIASGAAPTGENRTGVAGVGYLENPGPHSFQSGIGVISGWVCDAETVAIAIGDTGRQTAAYGTERLDTEETCGDTDNGFGLLFNWNLLGDGDHTVVAFVDDEELGRATVRVTTLGEEFLRGAEGECVAEDFPTDGETVTLEWQQNSQNFVITDIE